MPLLPTLPGWNFARRVAFPNPGEDLMIELRVTNSQDERRVFHACLKSLGFRRLLADHVSLAEAPDDSALPSIKNAPAVVSFARDSALYRFETTIETAYASGTNEYLLSMNRPKRVDRLQRRNAYRVTVETRTTYRELSGMDGKPSALLNAQIINLSEGGILLGSAMPISEGRRIVIRVPSGRDGVPMDVMAACIECRPVASPRGSRYLSRLRFEDEDQMRLTDEQRDAILRYVFEQQRLMLQTRRLLNGSPNKKSPAVD